MGSLTTDSVLRCLAKARLVELGRVFDVAIPLEDTKDAQIERLKRAATIPFENLLRHLGRDELKSACRAHDLDDSGRARAELASRLMEAYKPGAGGEVIPSRLARAKTGHKEAPDPGDIVQVRQRQYLVNKVTKAPKTGHATLVDLVCLDDDAQGRKLSVLWELELGARILQPETHGLGDVDRFDPPRHFAAYLHALKWNCVTATDANLFQAPFRAGIMIKNYQLPALKKALALPRVNLFIADDVGLGKTIEAGLVLQELLLRQRVDWVLIVCPAAVALQWRDEMQHRFGLHFEIYNRRFVARRRQERGFGINPWTTHTRFIITYQTLRRPEYRDPLLQRLGERVKKSLLIMDEAHNAAPSSAAKYAVDSRTTKVIQDVAPRFENRLFLSATPHNGHSNSFSALLELLDRQRFTRGVKVHTDHLEPIMLRRLKSDLRKAGEKFPKRKLIQVELFQENGAWYQQYRTATGVADKEKMADIDQSVGRDDNAASDPHPAPELELSEMLTQYADLVQPKKKRAKLVFINLQKRLLSSIEAFQRTLRVHARGVGKKLLAEAELEEQTADKESPEGEQLTLDTDDDPHGVGDEVLEHAVHANLEKASRSYISPTTQARELLDRMLSIADCYRLLPDAKAHALLAWIQRYQCRAAQFGGADPDGKRKDRKWSNLRVIIFTEYGDTKRYLRDLLRTAVSGTDRAQDRIMVFHGGMSDEQREEVQNAFNSPPQDHPVRILIATDAAREGVNLQAHCADLIHYDVPWNPARMEQRNGRIDRTLQPSPEVRCYYFFYPHRQEDKVMRTLVEKVHRIQKELGSLGDVVMNRMRDALENYGIDPQTTLRLDRAETLGDRVEVAEQELESQRKTVDTLKKDIDHAGKILNNSRKVMDFEPALLRDAINVNFELMSATPLEEVELAAPPTQPSTDPESDTPDDDSENWLTTGFQLPDLPESWQRTLDTLRRPRARDEAFWDWRKTPPLPVVFDPPTHMRNDVVHLHLQHPFTQRILSRFRSQGYSAHDLNRVTIIRNPKDALVRVIAFARLSLFGPGATRLHDKIISIAARWLESGGKDHLRPFADDADRKAIEHLEASLQQSPDLKSIRREVRDRLCASAPNDYAKLWPHLEAEADAEEHEARRLLATRAAEESLALRTILSAQRTAIRETIEEKSQTKIKFTDREKDQERQFKDELKYMEERLKSIDKEVADEPEQIKQTYEVVLTRLEPVGLVYLWPTTR